MNSIHDSGNINQCFRFSLAKESMATMNFAGIHSNNLMANLTECLYLRNLPMMTCHGISIYRTLFQGRVLTGVCFFSVFSVYLI